MVRVFQLYFSIADMEWLDAVRVFRVEGIDRHTNILGCAFGAWIGSKVIIEGMILLHHHDKVLDRRFWLGSGARRGCPCVRRQGERETHDDCIDERSKLLHGRTS